MAGRDILGIPATYAILLTWWGLAGLISICIVRITCLADYQVVVWYLGGIVLHSLRGSGGWARQKTTKASFLQSRHGTMCPVNSSYRLHDFQRHRGSVLGGHERSMRRLTELYSLQLRRAYDKVSSRARHGQHWLASPRINCEESSSCQGSSLPRFCYLRHILRARHAYSRIRTAGIIMESCYRSQRRFS